MFFRLGTLVNRVCSVEAAEAPAGLSGAPQHLQTSNSFLLLPETCLSMDTSSGSPTLDGRLTSTPSCGSSSSSTGESRSLLAAAGLPEHTCPHLSVCWQAGPGQPLRPEALADWRGGLQDWTALLPLLVSNQPAGHRHSDAYSPGSDANVLSPISLRTSETSYLNEAFSFYSAIRHRSYYFQVNKENR